MGGFKKSTVAPKLLVDSDRLPRSCNRCQCRHNILTAAQIKAGIVVIHQQLVVELLPWIRQQILSRAFL